MPVTQTTMDLGSFNVELDGRTPDQLLRHLRYFHHIAVIPGRVDPSTYGDGLLDMARYVGVLRSVAVGDTYSVAGAGMALWLGDEQDKGQVFMAEKTFNSATFANTIRELLPVAIHEGTIHSVQGSYSGRHRWQTPRRALDYVCGLFGAEWRVNNNATLDAGTVEQLYVTDPETIIVRKEGGRDMRLRGLLGEIATERDISEWTNRVLLLGEGVGQQILTAISEALDNPYRDIHGNPVDFTKVISESETSGMNAQLRADLARNQASTDRRSVSLSADDFDISGSFDLGDAVYVFDPANDLVDLNLEVPFQGRTYYPMVLRVTELTWPVAEGHTVAIRDHEGGWHDLSPYVQWESGSTQMRVGAPSWPLLGDSRPPGDRIFLPESPDTFDPNTWPDAPPLALPFSTGVYLDAEGRTRAWIRVGWDMPLNTDGSVITDGSHFIVRWRRKPVLDETHPDYDPNPPWSERRVEWPGAS